MNILGKLACDGGLTRLDVWPAGGTPIAKSQKADRSRLRPDRPSLLIFCCSRRRKKPTMYISLSRMLWCVCVCVWCLASTYAKYVCCCKGKLKMVAVNWYSSSISARINAMRPWTCR